MIEFGSQFSIDFYRRVMPVEYGRHLDIAITLALHDVEILLREDRSGACLAGIVIIHTNSVFALVKCVDITNCGGKYDRVQGRSRERKVSSAGVKG